MDQLRACGVLLVRGDPVSEFLLMRHMDRWDLPKGHMEPGETDIECAIREMFEETGVSKADIELDPDFQFKTEYTVTYKRTGNIPKRKTVVIFLARLIGDIPIEPTEHLDFEWFRWNPPHEIQENTIDPLLAQVAEHIAKLV